VSRPSTINPEMGKSIFEDKMNGMSQKDIAAKHGVSRMAVSRHLTKVSAIVTIPSKDALRLELTRDLADLKLGKLLSECEKNYDKAIARGDEQMAGSWAIQWGNAVDKLLKVTGRYNTPQQPSEPIKIVFEDA
jgi:transcriptional regulator with XRE-family HTH domain